MDKTPKQPTYRVLQWLLCCLLVVSLLPLLKDGWYDHPSADDLSMGLEAGLTFRETGSFLQTLGAGFTKTGTLYRTWIGYFTSAFLSVLPPQTWGEGWYRITPLLALGSLCLGTALFLHALLVRCLDADRYVTGCITALVLILSIQCLPAGSARVEGLYWYSGAINYTFLYGLGLVWLALLLCLADPRDAVTTTASDPRPIKSSLPLCIIASLLGFLIGGGNYMTALSCAMVAVLMLLWALLRDRFCVLLHLDPPTSRPHPWLLVLPCLCQLLGFMISCAAPGNRIRGAGISGMGAIQTVLFALYYVLHFCVDAWSDWAMWLFLVMLAPFLWAATRRCRLRFQLPGLMVILAWGFAGANIAPPLYATGNIEAGRIQALFWFQYVLLLVLLEGYLIGWLRRILTGHIETQVSGSQSMEAMMDQALAQPSSASLRFLGVTCCVFLFGAALQVQARPEAFTSTSALLDLVDGSAQAYDDQYNKRLEKLLDDTSDAVTLTPYTERPSLLFFSDISEDSEEWSNQAMAQYYGKTSVRLGTD